MISFILKGILALLTNLLSIFLAPINSLLTSLVPDFTSALTSLGHWFSQAGTYAGFILDSMFISHETISILISVLVMRLTLPYLLSAIKIVVKWWRALKL